MSGEGSGTADMTAQEQELLQYLEDLQANNPAEYEMLVKDLQEKEMARTGRHASSDDFSCLYAMKISRSCASPWSSALIAEARRRLRCLKAIVVRQLL